MSARFLQGSFGGDAQLGLLGFTLELDASPSLGPPRDQVVCLLPLGGNQASPIGGLGMRHGARLGVAVEGLEDLGVGPGGCQVQRARVH